MVARKIAVGLQIGTQPPLRTTELFVLFARLMRLDSIMAIDHFQNIFPTAIWDRELSWIAAQRPTPHEHFDYQVFLGRLASQVGRMRLGVGVTDAIRRHPVVIAQAMLTLAHMTKRAPILGIGAGERLNIEPYGFDFSHPVGRLEEALKIIRMCFRSTGPVSFEGEYYRLDGARLDLKAPAGKTPAIWVGAHGPRMLRLTGLYGDGWYPTMIISPADYASKLAVIHAAARDAGRDPESITPALHRFAVIGPTEHETQAMLDTKVIRAFGLSAPAELWHKLGREHPFGERLRGYVDIVPERYDRKTIEAAIAAVPPELLQEGLLLWGTPEQVARKLRKFGDAGLGHVVIAPISGLVSRRAALYSMRALYEIKRMLGRDS
ncbi:MAG TPA: LLM class flavin-dependent oxidoreductase [Ktedonobacterales bacterium]|nr:LLM class flavin-dependent oxidoreductase [Ktedonobacterales bacterium]